MDSDADDSPAMENLETAIAEPDQSERKKKHKNKKTKKNKPVQATIEVLPDRPERAPPIVGYFPSGFDPSASDSGGPCRARVFRNRKRPKRLQVVVSPSGSKVDFVGTNYSGEAEAGQQHCSYALGVLDKDTQTLKIVPIASNKIFRLEPKVRGLDLPQPQKEPESLEEGEVSAQKDRLNELYGTKKSIREAKKLKDLRQVDDPQTVKDMDEKIKQIAVKKEALESTQIHIDRNIPPYNVAATSPREAYPLDKIILKGEWGFLEDIHYILQGEAEVSWEAYPSFIINRIKKLQEIEDEEERKSLAGIFSFINHLIKFKDLHSMDGVSSAKHHKFPSILRQRFSNMFGNTESKRLASGKNDLLISYVLVLTLYADEFQTNLTDIAKDLRMSSITVRGHYEHLGCKLIRQQNIWFATLPTPLQFPQLRQKRRR